MNDYYEIVSFVGPCTKAEARALIDAIADLGEYKLVKSEGIGFVRVEEPLARQERLGVEYEEVFSSKVKDGWLSGLKQRLAKPWAFASRQFESDPVRSECVEADKRGLVPALGSSPAQRFREMYPSEVLGRTSLAQGGPQTTDLYRKDAEVLKTDWPKK